MNMLLATIVLIFCLTMYTLGCILMFIVNNYEVKGLVVLLYEVSVLLSIPAIISYIIIVGLN